jgi:hypothetical protein
MANTNLVIALVFAAIFGTVLIWLAFYYVYRYIHQRCLELDHWFLLTPPQWRSPCRHCQGTGRSENEKSRSRSSRRREKSRSGERRNDSMTRGHVKGERVLGADTEWNVIGREQIQRLGYSLPTSPSVQRRGEEEQYGPWQGWRAQANSGQQMYPQAYPQLPHVFPQTALQHPYTQDGRLTSPFTMLAARPVLSSMPRAPNYQKPPRKAYTVRSQLQVKSQPARKDNLRTRKTDYIHIVDDYPPIVKEAIMKAASQPPTSSSSSGSTISTEPAEEVHRKTIPQATPQFADTLPLQFPQSSQPTNQTKVFPTSYPRQWNGNMSGGGRPTEQVRYASPYTRLEGWMLRGANAEKRGYDPSNALPSSIALVR